MDTIGGTCIARGAFQAKAYVSGHRKPRHALLLLTFSVLLGSVDGVGRVLPVRELAHNQETVPHAWTPSFLRTVARDSASLSGVLFARSDDSPNESYGASLPGLVVWRAIGMSLILLTVGACWGLEIVLSHCGKSVHGSDEEKELLLPCDLRHSRHIIKSLGAAKYLFTWWFLLSSMQNVDEQESNHLDLRIMFGRWGCLAPSFFWMVSGFVNSYSKFTGPNPDAREDVVEVIVRKILPWYPLFLCSLTICAFLSFSTDAEDWSHFMACAFLVHPLIFGDDHFPWLDNIWPLSFLVVYLVFWSPVHEALRQSTDNILWTLFGGCFVVVLLLSLLQWFVADKIIVVLSQGAICFLYGQILAAWFVKRCTEKRAVSPDVSTSRVMFSEVHIVRKEVPFVVRYGATLGLVGLGVQALVYSPTDHLWFIEMESLVARGLCLPVIAVAIAGFACNKDPIAKLFCRRPFRWMEMLVFTTFILSSPLQHVFDSAVGWSGLTWTYSATLIILAAGVHTFAERPWRKSLGSRTK